MKSITAVFLTGFAALIFAACGAPPANNTPAPTNTNTAKAPAGPTASDLLTLDKGANDAYFKGDAKYFETFLSDKFGGSEKGKHETKADVLKFIAGVKCDMKTWSIDEPQMSTIDADTAVLTYKGTYDGTCNDGPGGKTHKVDSPMRAATVFVRNGDKWLAAWHSETAIMGQKESEKADAKAEPKKADAKAEPKKEEAKAEPKKEEPKKEEPKKADKAAPAANTAAAPVAEPPKADPNTDALVKLEQSGWDAWKAKDAKALDSMAAKNLAVVSPGGGWAGTRAEVLKSWDGSNCENVKNATIKNGFAWALSPTVEILTFDATADGMCDGTKNGPMTGTSIYIKEGDAWKITFGFLAPAGKM